MRTLLLSLIIGMLSFGLIANEALAKRFGGGRSFGVQRSHSSLFSSKPHPHKSIGQGTKSHKWRGFLGGLLAGGLLASLFMGHGLGTGILSWLFVGIALLFLINLLRRRFQPSWQSANTTSQQTPFSWKNSNFTAYQGDTLRSSTLINFVEEDFLREAKTKFIRLQAAYDQKNTKDLQEFTAPEVFAEIKMQLDEDNHTHNRTEVLHLEATLLDISEQIDSIIASVRFTGSIKENEDPVSSLDEIWHFRKFRGMEQWVVGGIQQHTSTH